MRNYDLLNGMVYLKKSDTYTANRRTSLSGTFTLADGIPYYVHKYEDAYGSIDPSILLRSKTPYPGILHLRESPSLAIPSEQKGKFKFSHDFRCIEIGKILVPLDNIAYLDVCIYDINYLLIPVTNVAAIQYEFTI